MSFRRQAFDIAGSFLATTGFSQETSLILSPIGEDLEFSIRVRMKTGKRIVYDPYAKVWHRIYKNRLTLKYFYKRAFWIGRSRRMLQKFYDTDQSKDLFATERGLLQRVLTCFLPETLEDIFISPKRVFARLSVASVILLFVSFGYFNLNFLNDRKINI